MSVSGLVTAIGGGVRQDGYKYHALSASGQQRQRAHAEPDWLQRSARLVKMLIGSVVLVTFLLMMTSFGYESPGCELTGSCTDDVSRSWGQYSPWFPAPSELDGSVPHGCRVTFAQVLSRHGARWPTSKKSDEYRSTVRRIQETARHYGVGFEFLRRYEYDLGADDLTLLGQQQMVESGLAFYRRYEALARNSTPFIRASGSGRVVASAVNFTQGFFQDRAGLGYGNEGDDQLSETLKSILVIPEEPEFNNTLDPTDCPGFEQGPASKMKEERQNTWLGVFAPRIRRRLNSKLPGADLTLPETVHLMDLCPFNTVAAPGPTAGPSDFCRLFSLDEWTSYDYYQSLDKWYGAGRGNPLGPSQGVGFGNELIARLTGRPVDDHTTTNTTLDSSARTFPLDRTLYADFSHDNAMSSIFAALGLYDGTEKLSAKHRMSPQQTGGFASSWVVPFSARMYVEKMRCEGGEGGDGTEEGEKEELVRVLVNDRVIPLKGCGADELGRCRLGDFVESLSFVRSGGEWGGCYSD